MAEGRRPVPFRTRKLSLPAPMVLRGGPRGRVGRRRTFFARGAARVTGPAPLVGMPGGRFRRVALNRRPRYPFQGTIRSIGRGTPGWRGVVTTRTTTEGQRRWRVNQAPWNPAGRVVGRHP